MKPNTEFLQREGQNLLAWLAGYFEHPERYRVLPSMKPGDLKRHLPPMPPDEPEPFAAILADLENLIAPALTHWNHPGFMAYFANTGSMPGILGETAAAAFNNNAMLWRTGPASVELESVTVDWVRHLIGLPMGFCGFVHETASLSSLIAIAAAREHAAPEIRVDGLVGAGKRLRMYASDQAHSSIEKACIALGIGQKGLRKIGCDDAFRMRADELERAIDEDLAQGWTPFCVTATVGTTSTTSVDPVAAIAKICARHGLWLHIDAAYAGSAAILPEMKWITEGWEHAHSLVTNPHKWLFTPIDCSLLFCKLPDVVKRAFSLVPEYLKTGEADSVMNPMDYTVSLGKRFRSLKLWMVIRTYGVRGLQERLRGHIALAQSLAGWIRNAKEFEVMAPHPFSVVCFRFHPADNDTPAALNALNARLLDEVNSAGDIFISHTKLRDAYVLRIAIGNEWTEESHVRRAWELIREKARLITAG